MQYRSRKSSAGPFTILSLFRRRKCSVRTIQKESWVSVVNPTLTLSMNRSHEKTMSNAWLYAWSFGDECSISNIDNKIIGSHHVKRSMKMIDTLMTKDKPKSHFLCIRILDRLFQAFTTYRARMIATESSNSLTHTPRMAAQLTCSSGAYDTSW